MRRTLLALALALPVVGLAGGIVVNQLSFRQASTWTIPVRGYDPRDLLRGHFVGFTYDWEVVGDPALCRGGSCTLCLEREEGRVVARIAARASTCVWKVDVAASNIAVTPDRFSTPGFSSRLFVSETSVPQVTDMLAKRDVRLVALLTREGRLVPQRLEPAE